MRKLLLLLAASPFALACPVQAATRFVEMKSPGGIPFWYQARPDLPKSSLIAGFRDGLGYSLPGKEALYQIAPGLMERGAGEHSANDLVESMNDLDADGGIESEAFRTFANITAPPDKLAAAAELEHDILSAPRLEQKELDRIRKSLVDHNRENAIKAETIAVRTAWRYAYGDSVWTRNFDGTSFANITREDVDAWRKRVLARDNMVVAASGSLSGEAFGRIVDTAYGGLPEKSDVPRIEEPVFDARPKTIVIDSQQSQTILLQVAGTEIESNRDRLKYSLGLDVFGSGTESRLFKKVRGELGAAYGVSGNLTGRTKHDVLVIRAAVSHDKAQAALEAIGSEYARWLDKGVDAAEFEATRSHLKAALEEGSNQPGDDARQFVSAMLTGRPPNDTFDFSERLAGYTPAIINAGIAARFPKGPLLTIIVTPTPDMFKGDCVIKGWLEAEKCR